MSRSRRIRSFTGATIAALGIITASSVGTLAGGNASAAPAASATINVPSTYLGLADPFPFGVEALHVAVIRPGVLKFTLGKMCASLNPSVCAGYSLPMQVGWVNLTTGRSGVLTVQPRGAEVNTGRGLIGIGDLFGLPSIPGAATIQA